MLTDCTAVRTYTYTLCSVWGIKCWLFVLAERTTNPNSSFCVVFSFSLLTYIHTYRSLPLPTAAAIDIADLSEVNDERRRRSWCMRRRRRKGKERRGKKKSKQQLNSFLTLAKQSLLEWKGKTVSLAKLCPVSYVSITSKSLMRHLGKHALI